MENRDVGQSTNMAEAAVESPAARFFCHRCTLEISPVLPVRKIYIIIFYNNLNYYFFLSFKIRQLNCFQLGLCYSVIFNNGFGKI